MSVHELAIRNNVDNDIINAEIEPISAELVADEPVLAQIVSDQESPRPAWYRRILKAVAAVFSWLFGFAAMIVGLAVLATIPILQFLSLGYLLEASGRIARTGRLRDGFIGIDQFGRLGSIVLGTSLALLPVWFISSLTYSSLLLNGRSRETRLWGVFLTLATIATICHVLWAWFRGGRLLHFIWPAPVRFFRRIRQGGWIVQARDATCEFVEKLRLPTYFMLGIRGFAGAIIWLFIPVTLLAMGTLARQPIGTFLGLVGSFLMAIVVMYLPFLQTRFAVNNDFAELFRVSAVRDDFKRAPVAFWIALFFTLLFALPLYILKAELIPREAAWLPSLVFVIFMYPSRLAAGWAIARARRRDAPRHFVFRWSSRFAVVPVVAFYVGFVFLTQYVSWYGRWSLYEQHAFLLPVPFLGI
jgi:hypothetical protein